MIIKKIKFHNFMAYFGENIFEFPHDDEKNVSVIFAPNDTGKSCFFKGITFCLYGLKRKEKAKEIINVNAFHVKDYNSYVQIEGEHNGNKVEITRSIERKNTIKQAPKDEDFFQSEASVVLNDKKLLNKSDPSTADIDIRDYINSILHEDASKYFFFDGEKIEAYNIATESDYREAITRILGIREIENTASDFKNITKEFEKERDAQLSKQSEANEYLARKKEIEIIIENENRLLTDLYRANQSAIARRSKLEDELKSYEDAREKITRRQALRDEIIPELKRVVEKITHSRKLLFKEHGTVISAIHLYSQYVKENEFDLDNVDKYNFNNNVKEFLDSFMSTDYCVCGNEWTEKMREKVSSFISTQERLNSKLVKEKEKLQLVRELEKYSNKSGVESQKFNQMAIDLYEARKKKNSFQKELSELKKETTTYSEEKFADIQEEYNRVEKQINENLKKIENIKGKLEINTENLKGAENDLKKFKGINKEIDESENKYLLSSRIQELFEEYLEELRRSKREEVEKNATEIFMQLTNKPQKYKGIKITEDYNLEVRLNDGTTYRIHEGGLLNPSTGQSKIISLSYIAAINKSSNALAPVVIDNPVGLFSDEHRRSVTEFMPKFGQQVIFMVTEADMENYKQIIDPHVNIYYYLKDEITESSSLEVLGNKTVIYRKVKNI